MLNYSSNTLYVENLNLLTITKDTVTPFFCYSKAHIINQYNKLIQAFQNALQSVEIFYAVKANDLLRIIKIINSLGAGCDATSAGEIYKCLKVGVKPEQIIFSGVGKSAQDLKYAISQGITNFNVESIFELEVLQNLVTAANKTISVMLRLNLDVDAKTHDKISTSRKHDKFGIDIETIIQAKDFILSLKNIQLKGLAVHLGSQITTINVYEQAFAKLSEFVKILRQSGFTIESLDFGGGIGIKYTDEPTIDVDSYAKLISKVCRDLKVIPIIEPGRFLVGGAGLLVSQILYVKKAGDANLLVIDAGMNNLLRPALYGAKHQVVALDLKQTSSLQEYEVVGPLCESGDKIAKCQLPTMKEGEYVAIKDVGAYGSVMSSNYNAKTFVAEYLIENDQFNLIRKAQHFEDLTARDVVNR